MQIYLKNHPIGNVSKVATVCGVSPELMLMRAKMCARVLRRNAADEFGGMDFIG